MATDAPLPITCDPDRRLEYLSLAELDDFQADLKTLTSEEYAHLKDSLRQHGFMAPLFYWQAADGSRRLLDGHQRKCVIQREGWAIEAVNGQKNVLPAVRIEAPSEAIAAQILLRFAGQHGRVTDQGLYEFLDQHHLDPGLLSAFALPNLDLKDFLQGYYHDFEPVDTTALVAPPPAPGSTLGATPVAAAPATAVDADVAVPMPTLPQADEPLSEAPPAEVPMLALILRGPRAQFTGRFMDELVKLCKDAKIAIKEG